MVRLSTEAKVGLFVIVGIILLVYMSLRLGGIKFGRAEGYTLIVKLPSAAGLDKEASVRVAGVEVGRVKDIVLENNMAKLVLLIRPNIKIGKDFTAVLKTKGLLGEKYLELIPGSPNAPLLKEGDEITRIITYTDMDKLITILDEVATDLKFVTKTLSNVLGGPEGEASIRNIIHNIEEVSSRINRIVERNDEKLTTIVSNLEEFTMLLRDEGPGITDSLKRAAQTLHTAVIDVSKNINSLVDENRDNIQKGIDNLKNASLKLEETMETINSLTRKIGPDVSETVRSIKGVAKKLERGEGTIGRLITEPDLYDSINKTLSGVNEYLERAERFRIYLGYRGEYLFDAEDTKSYFSLKIQPKKDKFYLLEVVDDPRGMRKVETRQTTVNSTTTTTKEVTTSEDLKFSAQIAKRFKDLTLRAGLIESTGGAGIDYHLFGDRLRFFLEAFDFDKERNPHLKAGGTFHLNKYFYLTAGYDDFASKVGLESAYIGIGFTFEDEDIKYLFSSLPPIAF